MSAERDRTLRKREQSERHYNEKRPAKMSDFESLTFFDPSVTFTTANIIIQCLHSSTSKRFPTSGSMST